MFKNIKISGKDGIGTPIEKLLASWWFLSDGVVKGKRTGGGKRSFSKEMRQLIFKGDVHILHLILSSLLLWLKF